MKGSVADEVRDSCGPLTFQETFPGAFLTMDGRIEIYEPPRRQGGS